MENLTLQYKTPTVERIENLSIVMRNLEKIILFFNRKYDFDISQAEKTEQKAYRNLLARWDHMNFKRNQLTNLQFKKA